MKKNLSIFFIFFMLSTNCIPKKIVPSKNVPTTEEKKRTEVDAETFLETQPINRSEKIEEKDNVEIQGMILDMGVMIGIQMGASMANTALGSQVQMLTNQINKNSQTIQTHIQTFQTQIQKNQQIELQAMVSSFSQAQQGVQSQTSQATAVLNLQLDYLYKKISLEQPQQNYIFNQIQYDQLFSTATMLGPQGPLWKNPFSIGDWGYQASSNSFWQYQNSSLFREKTDTDGNVTNSSLQAENNSIFAEYYTEKQSYTIAGSITLHTIDYPFFTGIMLNKARWISGDFESVRKCRMIGIYGTSPENINIYFAQQFTMTDDQIKESPSETPLQTPLQQIINNKVQPSLSLPSNMLGSLPAMLYFSITNSPNSVTLKFWNEAYDLPSKTINKLNSDIYIDHGIGFISPGAVAQFNLTQPSDFIFTQQAISNYKD